MNYTKEEMIEAVDHSIETFQETVGLPESISIHPETAKYLFGDETSYKGVEIVPDEYRNKETFSVNGGIEEF